MKHPKIRDLDLTSRLSHDDYTPRMERLQHELAHLQQAYFLQGHRGVIVLEGVDAAGKGGLVRRVAWALDPRGFTVIPIAAPDDREKGQHWLQRFFSRLPGRGQIACFDRSWYGRVLVERVEGYASKEAVARAYDEIVALEDMLVADGIRVAKLLLLISPEEQLRRFEDRLATPRKRWKLTFEDFRNREKAPAYTDAFQDMLDRTSTQRAPWHIVASDSKMWSRVEAMQTIVKVLGEGVDTTPPPADPRLEAMAHELEARRSRS